VLFRKPWLTVSCSLLYVKLLFPGFTDAGAFAAPQISQAVFICALAGLG
jgi:hypothetical protein